MKPDKLFGDGLFVSDTYVRLAIMERELRELADFTKSRFQLICCAMRI
jgi:hypothetical protein